ncbi:MAG: DUF2062 domain-containing protein [Rhodospirillaceae bacterium]|nr:DUF2062 domain-containing protein [Rhodospirillaceae bacterium]MDD9918046.1 DUF2062 domain-containing protein [Rhodospirillaceae bacterium]MDD9929385.1 DUF2062 domain-containing protein [Rhodospirillaceae bacterium]
MANSLGRRLATRFRRLILYRLIMPVLRAKTPPEYTARSVLFGMLVAMTPTVGVQMPIVFLIWLPIRYLRPQWNFNVVVAMAWTWVTNVFTLGPIYYVFLVTGRLMLGAEGGLTGYDEFAAMLQKSLDTDAGIVESLWIYTVDLFRIWGVPMFVGSIPWAILASWLSYRWSLRLVNRFRRRRQEKATARRAMRQQS